MSYYSEHQCMKPVLDLACQLDIATSPHPRAIFEASNGGFQVWCTPQDHPQGWNGISMIPVAFSKPYEYGGGPCSVDVYYGIVSLNVEIQRFSISVDVGNGHL